MKAMDQQVTLIKSSFSNIFVMLLCTLSVACFLATANPANTYAITLEKVLDSPVEEKRAQALFHTIRCMVCSGESIADSRAKLAIDLRQFIRNNITDGESDDEIITSLRQAYGDDILMQPPLQLNTYLLWVAPLIMILFASLASTFYIRQRKA